MAMARPPEAAVPAAARRGVLLTAAVLAFAAARGLDLPGPAFQPPGPEVHQPLHLALCIDLNVDPWWKLAALPGIGPTLAARIVAYREGSAAARPFAGVAGLQAVRGIGPATAAAAAPLVCGP